VREAEGLIVARRTGSSNVSVVPSCTLMFAQHVRTRRCAYDIGFPHSSSWFFAQDNSTEMSSAEVEAVLDAFSRPATAGASTLRTVTKRGYKVGWLVTDWWLLSQHNTFHLARISIFGWPLKTCFGAVGEEQQYGNVVRRVGAHDEREAATFSDDRGPLIKRPA
jgi:hypothetical protein